MNSIIFNKTKYLWYRKTAKAAAIFILTASLNGCALLGLILKLAPLIPVFVEYSPPIKTETGQIICVKAFRHIDSQSQQTKIVTNEYFLVMLDNKGIEISEYPLKLDTAYYPCEDFIISKKSTANYVLNFRGEEQIFDIKEIFLMAHK